MVKVLIFIFLIFLFFLIYILGRNTSKKIIYINFILIFLIFISLILIFVNQENNTGKKYYSPEFDGEQVTPGYFDEN
tara:strand:- start:4362 stop:4592 length:231 start_codon:yes stop_codon:yes gene_type:complete